MEPAEISRVVRNESEILVDDAWHEVPVGLAGKTQPTDIISLMATFSREERERGV